MTFTPADRSALRDTLIAASRADTRITGAALTGSAAVGTEDEWSDIDLALGLAPDASQPEVLADWTARMYADHAAVHHTDVWSRSTVYRDFLLESTLQVTSSRRWCGRSMTPSSGGRSARVSTYCWPRPRTSTRNSRSGFLGRFGH